MSKKYIKSHGQTTVSHVTVSPTCKFFVHVYAFSCWENTISIFSIIVKQKNRVPL